jgi:hypothetical protein
MVPGVPQVLARVPAMNTLHAQPVIPGPAPGLPAIPGPRIPLLDSLRATRGIYTEFYDPGGQRYGLPTYPYRWAPSIYATVRQLRTRGLRPGGQQPAAQILWKHAGRRRVAYLYLVCLALPKRTATPAQLIAIGKALTARMTCGACGSVHEYCMPKSTGVCNECAAGGLPRPARVQAPGGAAAATSLPGLISLHRAAGPAAGLSLRSPRAATDLFPGRGPLEPAAPAQFFLCPLGKHLGRPGPAWRAGPLPWPGADA